MRLQRHKTYKTLQRTYFLNYEPKTLSRWSHKAYDFAGECFQVTIKPCLDYIDDMFPMK